MKTGIVKFAMLFMAGPHIAVYRHMCVPWVIEGAVFLVAAYTGWHTGHVGDAIEFSQTWSGVVWVGATAAMLATIRQQRDLRSPRIIQKTCLVAACVAVLAIVMPTAVLALAGFSDPHHTPVLHIFMTLALGAAVGTLVATLPFAIVMAGMAVVPQLLWTLDIPALLASSALWQSPWCDAVLAALALLAALWRALSLIRSETTTGGFWSTPSQLRFSYSSKLLADAQHAGTTYPMYPVATLPSWRHHAGASLWTRISALLGPPFSPGTLRKMLLAVGVAIGTLTLVAWFCQQWLSEVDRRTILTVLKWQIPLLTAVFLSSMTRFFATRLRTIYRPQSAELAEFALLPGWSSSRSALANYRLVLFGKPLRLLVVVTGIACVAAWLSNFATLILLLMALLIVALTIIEVAHYLAVGRPLVEDPMLEVFAYLAVLIPMAALTFLTMRSSSLIWLGVMLTVVAIACLTALYSFRRGSAAATQLPHPFLDAQERRVLTLS